MHEYYVYEGFYLYCETHWPCVKDSGRSLGPYSENELKLFHEEYDVQEAFYQSYQNCEMHGPWRVRGSSAWPRPI